MDISYKLADVVKGTVVVAILTVHDDYFRLMWRMGQENPANVDVWNVMDTVEFIGAEFV